MKLSIFTAGIRPQNWMNLYRSIPNATTITDRELVIVSPYDLPRKLRNRSDVRLIRDWGCPTRCYQLGLLHSRGDYVVFIADDGVFSPGLAIDKAFNILPKNKGVVSFKYSENNKNIKQMEDPSWWMIGYHTRLKACVPDNYLLTMIALSRRDHLIGLGGWDCRFEHAGLGHVDLAIRLQNDGANIVMGEKLMDLDWMKGSSGDHGPITEAHRIDKYLFSKIPATNSTFSSCVFLKFANTLAETTSSL